MHLYLLYWFISRCLVAPFLALKDWSIRMPGAASKFDWKTAAWVGVGATVVVGSGYLAYRYFKSSKREKVGARSAG